MLHAFGMVNYLVVTDVPYMKCGDKRDLVWLFPEKVKILEISKKIVLVGHISVSYSSLTAMIQCQISSNLCNEIQEKFNNFDLNSLLLSYFLFLFF